MTYRLTRQARQQMLEIWAYIAGDNEPAADRLIDLLIHHFQLLGENPYAVAVATIFAKDTAAFRWVNTSSYIVFRSQVCRSCTSFTEDGTSTTCCADNSTSRSLDPR